MTSASMTFGRPTRLRMPRGAHWAAAIAVALISALRRLDEWLLGQRAQELQSPEDLLEWARQIEPGQPAFAADLRAAALRAMAQGEH